MMETEMLTPVMQEFTISGSIINILGMLITEIILPLQMVLTQLLLQELT